MTKWKTLTEEEAWALPVDEVMAIPLNELMEGYTPVTEEERAWLFATLGKPTGVGLESWVVGVEGPALPEIELYPGDLLMENQTNRRGVKLLKICRLGKMPVRSIYEEQAMRAGAKIVAWDETVNDHRVHTLTLWWR